MCGKRLATALPVLLLVGSTFGCSLQRHPQAGGATAMASVASQASPTLPTAATLEALATPLPTPSIPKRVHLPGVPEPATPNVTDVPGTCATQLPASWQAAFDGGRIETAADETLLPIAVAANSTTVFASDYTPARRSLFEIDTQTSQRTKIMRFAGTTDQVLGADFDGR